MAEKIKLNIRDSKRLLSKRRWDIISEFERREKAISLKKLTTNESLGILEELLRFGQKFTDSKYYQRINSSKIRALSRAHTLFRELKT